jgi:hypothetical protein
MVSHRNTNKRGTRAASVFSMPPIPPHLSLSKRGRVSQRKQKERGGGDYLLENFHSPPLAKSACLLINSSSRASPETFKDIT